MHKTGYFDYSKAARELCVPGTILERIIQDAKIEFPKDKMMFELHVLRALKSLFWKKEPTRKPVRRKRAVLTH
ncbi:MAG: hypothetical protein V1913_00020 [Fibrobacterota bacterium]